MPAGPSFLDDLKHATERAAAAENEFRRDIARRIKAMEDERAFAFRRYNLMRAVADAVASAESEEIAIAGATVILRSKLGWSNDSEARSAVLSHFSPVAQAAFASLTPADEKETPRPDVLAVLGEFERWYAATHPNPFWVLFENYMPETPVVDF
jgi:hypothetical protein